MNNEDAQRVNFKLRQNIALNARIEIEELI